jgi:type I restriction enzyme S subunit
MSSKTKTTDKKAVGKPALVPKLRFPQFREAGAWTTKTLNSVASISTEKVGDNTCIPMSITSGVGLVSQMEKYGRVIAGSSYKNYLLLKKNDFAYNKSATKAYTEGFIALYSGDELAAVPNSIFTCFRIKDDSTTPQYLNYLFLGNLHGQWLRKFIEVGARAHGSLSIDDDDLMALPIPLPGGKFSRAEQQKIAECLTSLDDLIAAHGRKLDALKTHKKGLMEQLFPLEGETVPRLRYPEFQDAPEWEIKSLGDIAIFFKGKGISKAEIDPNGKQPCIRYGELYTRYGEVIERVYSTTNIASSNLFLSRKNDIIIPGSGETKEDIAKASCVLSDDVAFGGDINVIRTSHNGVFLSYYLNGPKKNAIAKVAQGHTVVHLYPSQLGLLTLAIPDAAEQMEIADCLSSIDEMINALIPKLEALKTHKKGLMQQLFPSPNINQRH